MPELIANIVSKSPIISEIFLEKVLELCSRHRVLGLGAMFILVPLLDHQSAEEQSGKRDFVGFNGPSDFEVIFILLTEQVAIQV